MVEEGQKVVIRGVFEASPEPNVLWFHNQNPVRPSHDVKIEVGNKDTSISFTKVCSLSHENFRKLYTSGISQV